MKTWWTWAKRIGGVLFCAAWAAVIAYFLVDCSQRVAPVAPPLDPEQFAAAVVGLGVLLFIGLLLAFSSEAAKPMISDSVFKDPPPPADLGVTCPTCHAAMQIQGEYRHPVEHIYIWRCSAGHWWRRVGANAADATYPWKVLSAAPGSDSASPKVLFG